MANATSEYLQPHEGITGNDRTEDDLLALDEKALARRAIMIGMAECLHRATLVGNPAPVVARMYERMSHPQPGDVVVETTHLGRTPESQVHSFGILIAHRKEWGETDGQWAALLAGGAVSEDDRFPDDAWYVQYGPAAADICRWTNCSFIAIPTDMRQFRS